MIHIVTPEYAGFYQSELKEMRRLRYRVFKERMNWEVDAVDGEERDQFDDCRPTYVLAYDRPDTLIGSWRLLPTTGPYMLRDVFSHLLEGMAPPNDAATWETSRFAVDCDPTSKAGLCTVNRVTGEMFCGLLEFCLQSGVRNMVSVYDVRIARLLNRLGGPLWSQPKWRSARHRIGDTIAFAGMWDVTQEILDEIRDRCGIQSSVLALPRGSAEYATKVAA